MKHIVWFGLFVTVCVTSSSFASDIVINEIMYHPSSENVREEYIELLNTGTNSVPMRGWRISQGVDFTITNDITLAPGGYLVIAADVAVFSAKYPGITNVVGGWTGVLGNNGEAVQIENALGENVDTVVYANEGDWAIRQRGALFDNNHRGWVWSAAHDGLGSSLELVNARFSNNSGQNWASSTNFNGTPGRANSVARSNIAPVISDVQHSPAIPTSSDAVTITAKVEDESVSGIAVTLFYRNATSATPPAFSLLPMLDDGQHNDGLAGDSVYGVVLPAQPNFTVTEFYVQATDGRANARTWPAAAQQVDGSFAQTANALYQVDDGVYAGAQPMVKLVMTEAERQELADFSIRQTDAQMNATFIHRDANGTQVRYNCGARIRGAGSRQAAVPNYRLDIPNDRVWKDVTQVNLNAQYVYLQILGSAVAQRAGLPAANSRAVQVRVNGRNLVNAGAPSYGSYCLNEVIGSDYAANHLVKDPGGNIYRGSIGQHTAVLNYLGTDPQTYINAGYSKASNGSENDWTDLFELTAILSNEPDATYAQRVRGVVNVEQWMRYFAVFTLMESMETSLATGQGDDWALYRGLYDTRFISLPHDLDTIFGDGDTPVPPTANIFRMVPLVGQPMPPHQPANVTILNRFMLHPDFVPAYFSELKRLEETVFSANQLNPLVDQLLASWVPANVLTAIKNFAVARNANVLNQIPLTLTVNSSLALSNGFPRTTAPFANLTGRVNAIDTRFVRVNGTLASMSAWQGAWGVTNLALRPGINRLLVQAFGVASNEVGRATIDLWYDDGSVVSAGGTLAADATWTANEGPYIITGSLLVPVGRTLTIEAGTTVFLGASANLTVANGGRLVAQGTDLAPIRIGRVPGGTAWGGITINGGPDSPESVISYAHIEGNDSTAIEVADGTARMDHLTFGTTTRQYIAVDRASFVISDCVFPTPTAGFEMVHGTGGIKAGGHGVIMRSFFGAPNGYNDTVDFTGGNRPGPIIHFIDNVFTGSGDDILDLDSTDAWVEGNIFMHAHRNGSPDSSSAVSGGADNADTSQITIIGNIIFDCDHAALAKQGNSYTMINNTVVHQSHVGGVDPFGAIVIMADTGTAEGAGFYLEGNIIYDAENLVQNRTTSIVTFSNNLMQLPWAGPGGGNFDADSRFKHLPQVSETLNFATWQQAQVMKDWLSLRSGSPARGAGPNGLDLGGVVPLGISISGEPAGTTRDTSATLRVGVNVPGINFTNGSGYTHYRWRLDGGAWSAETLVNAPIILTGLADGPHYVEATGKRDSGLYQDDPLFGPTAVVTRSRTWTVDSSFSDSLVINEVLARNTSGPDLIELYNGAPGEIDLSGMGLTDDLLEPFKFKFPVDTFLGPGQYLVLQADDEHLGFAINQHGGGVFLYSVDGLLIDSIEFGPQVPDLSIGRVANGEWALTRPTFGAPNQPAPVGDTAGLKINEWLAAGASSFPEDFVELYNSDALPVALIGLYLSDEPAGTPYFYAFGPLSYIDGHGHLALLADGNELPFHLAAEQGSIGLLSGDRILDYVCYGSQTFGLAQGRRPSGGDQFDFFPPTPNAPNPGKGGDVTVTNIAIGLFPLTNIWRYEASGTDLGTGWRMPGYDDSAWLSGPALLYNENNQAVPFRNTFLPFTTPQQTTFYFRTTFVVETNLDGFALRGFAYIDDGAVLYINGIEALRVRMPAGEISYSTFASGSPPPDGDASLETLTLSSAALAPGVNVLAVEVHQQLPTSSDIVWGMALEAQRPVTNVIAAFAMINEVMANNRSITNSDGTITDWVEVFNPANITLDLSDQSLTDQVSNPRRWIFPAGTTIGPHEYLVVRFDPDAPPSTNSGPILNTGFGLSANGDNVLLFDAPVRGGALVDLVTFGLQVSDYSIARVPSWNLALPTPGSANIAAALAPPSAVKVNEWMAAPNSGDDWFELFNSSAQPVALGGLYLTDDLNSRQKSQIPPLSFISHSTNGFAQFFADSHPENGPDHVNFKLNNGGETIALVATNGQVIHAIQFGAQASGISEGSLPDGSTNIVRFPGSASPAESNFLPLDRVAINEALTHTDLPLEDAIELQNISTETVDIGGWFLSDRKDELQFYRIPPDTLIPPGGFAVFYEHDFNPAPGFLPGFALSSSHGDQVYLSEADAGGQLTGYRAVVKFGAAENGIAFGRYETSEGFDFTAVTTRTLGASNSPVRIGPVVITEIMYHPPDIGGTNDNVVDEFIELQNISAASVDLAAWRMRDAVDFNFPSNTTVSAGAYLLLVSFDPIGDPAALIAFRGKYGVATGVRVLGPYRGKLDNSSDNVELYKPDLPTPDGEVPFLLVDKVHYRDVAPWASAVDLGQASLQRRNSAAYGNDPVNWLAGTPTPGAATGDPLFPYPEITTEPVGATVAPGTPVTLAAAVDGAEPLSYQWRLNGKDVPGATEPSLIISGANTSNAGTYRLRVSNPYGAAISGPAAVVLATQPAIARQPQSKIVAAGSSTVLNVKATGTLPLHYQWQFAGTNLPGATDFQLLLADVQSGNQGQYRAIIQNSYNTITSEVATVTIQDPATITQHPTGATVLAGTTLTLNSAATGTQPLTYQWRIDGIDIPGANGPSLTISQIQPSQGGRYTLRVSNAVGSATSQEAIISVLVPPNVNILAIDPNAAEAGLDPGVFQINRVGTTNFSITVNLARSGTATSGADFTPLPNSIQIPAGQTNATVTLTPINDGIREAAETVTLQIAAGAGYTVGSPASATVTIADDDNAPPTIVITSPAPQTLYAITPVNVQFTVTANDSDGSMQRVDYFNNGSNYLGAATATPFSFTWTNAATGTNRITAVATDNLGATGTSGLLTFFVNIPPKISIATPADGDSYPPGSNITVRASASDADGTIARVEFFEGGASIGVVTNAPFNLTWGSSQLGIYSLRAVATDNRGMSSASAPVSVAIRPPNNTFADMFADRGNIFSYVNVVNGSNNIATREPNEPRAYSSGTRTVWLRWVAPASGTCVMQTLGSSFDTVLAVFTNNPPYIESVTNLGFVAENDDSSNLQSRVEFQALEDVPYQIRVEGFGPVDAGTITFTQTLASRAPHIVTHPQNALVLTGGTANFSFTASATAAYTNQWRLNGTNLTGATGPSLVVSNVIPGKDGDYSVLVGNSFGVDISRSARLEIGSRPVIVTQPVSQTVVEGQPAKISITMAGSLPMSYRWRKGAVYVYEYTTNSLVGFISFNSTQLTNAGSYAAAVTNILGNAIRLSDAAVLTVLADSDHDGMPDSWETQYGFDPSDPSDGYIDSDGDGVENWKEYVAGTNPRDPASYLKITRLDKNAAQATVTFNAVSNRSYTMQFSDALGTPWSPLQSLGSRTTNRIASVIDPGATNRARFYRIAIP